MNSLVSLFVSISEQDLLDPVKVGLSAPAQIPRNELDPTSDIVSRFRSAKICSVVRGKKKDILKHTRMINLKHLNYECDHPEVSPTGH